jgi:polyisoprenoid-binding protein YceI
MATLALCLTAQQGAAATAKDCKVTFKTKGQPVLVNIEGKSEAPCEGSFKISGANITESHFKLSLLQLDTGIGLRNKHLRENYLHTEKFPDATLIITSVADLPAQMAGTAPGKSAFVGDLELHGVKKTPMESVYQIKGKHVTAEFTVDVPDYGIERPSFMGVKIVDKVFITVEFEIND